MTSVPFSITSPPEKIEVFAARSGARSLRVNGRALHSPYDPAREAQRFVAENLGGSAPGTVVILGEGLGHVSEAVRASFPGARCIAVVYSEPVFRASGGGAIPTWHPASSEPLAAFLRARIGELDIEGLALLEWPASAQAFPDASRAANEALRRVAQELNGSFATTSAAAGTWLRNSIANFLGLQSALPALTPGPDRPIIVAAPGPSLERAVSLIAESRPRVLLWALPSSCSLLADAGLPPDLVILTDPGYYGMHHISASRLSAPIAMTLSAARGAWSVPVYPLSQPVFYERAFLRALGLRSPELSPHGTVAATAINLALAATSAPVIVAGLDMCSRDISSHARPNAFDTLLHVASRRLAPHTGLWYGRSVGQREEKVPGSPGTRISPALRTYAGWFDQAGPAPVNLYRLLPSAVSLGGMRPLGAGDLAPLVRGFAPAAAVAPSRERTTVSLPGLAERKRIARNLLQGWAAILRAAEPACAWDPVPGEPGPEATPLSIGYMVEPRLVMEARRLHRLGRDKEARDAAGQMLARAADRLADLAGRASDGA